MPLQRGQFLPGKSKYFMDISTGFDPCNYLTLPLLSQRCTLHPTEGMSYICMHAECLQNGFFCKSCIKIHDDHRVLHGYDFLEVLKGLVNYDGSYKTQERTLDTLTAKASSCLMATIEELEQMTELFKEKLDQFKFQFDKYRQVSADVAAVNNLIYYAHATDALQESFKEQLQTLLPKLVIENDHLLIQSITSCQNENLFIPDERLITESLETFHQKIKVTHQQLIQEFQKPFNYKKFDLRSTMRLVPNKFGEPVVFEQANQEKVEERVVQKFIIDRPDTKQPQQKKIRSKIKLKQEPTLEDLRDGCERVEKVQIIAGHRVWYLDLVYPKFRAKNWVVEPRNACLICKCHPKFARIREFLHVKYGDLYGPVPCDDQLHRNFKIAVQNRKDMHYLVERAGIYFHDLCVYWSSSIEVDDTRGVIDFDTFHYAVRQAHDTCCYLCKRRGATMKCNSKECEIWVHYYCWKGLDPTQQFLDQERYRILCNRHAGPRYQKPAWLFQNTFIEKFEQENNHNNYIKIDDNPYNGL